MLRSLGNPALLNNLPAELSTFVGRATELKEILPLVDSSRLVTLTGAGGLVILAAGQGRAAAAAPAGRVPESFDLSGAEAVCGVAGLAPPDVVDLLGSLVDKSLVGTEQGPENLRYRLLETIRQFAGERLIEADDAAAIRSAHCEHFGHLIGHADEYGIEPNRIAVWVSPRAATSPRCRAQIIWFWEHASTVHRRAPQAHGRRDRRPENPVARPDRP